MANTKGISVSGDVLVNETADGVNLNDLWAEIGRLSASKIPGHLGGNLFSGATRARRLPAPWLQLPRL